MLCVIFAGCGGGCSGSAEESGPSGTSTQRTESSGGSSVRAVDGEPSADPGPLPQLRITVDVDDYAGHATARIANVGAEVQLSSELSLERRRGEDWSPVDGAALALRYDCASAAPECVTLAPGAVFIPPAWLGTIGDAQCACERCVPAEEGTYRFVARSCAGAHTVTGDPFELVRR